MKHLLLHFVIASAAKQSPGKQWGLFRHHNSLQQGTTSSEQRIEDDKHASLAGKYFRAPKDDVAPLLKGAATP